LYKGQEIQRPHSGAFGGGADRTETDQMRATLVEYTRKKFEIAHPAKHSDFDGADKPKPNRKEM
jgi:hypothetical protein